MIELAIGWFVAAAILLAFAIQRYYSLTRRYKQRDELTRRINRGPYVGIKKD